MNYPLQRVSVSKNKLNVSIFCAVFAAFLLIFLGAPSVHGQGQRDQLIELRQRLNQIQQKLIDKRKKQATGFAQQKDSNTSEYKQLFSQQILKRGDHGQAVKDLQAALNSVPNLVVAESGPGSVGEETTYFGPKTEQAVIAFQNKYKEDILSTANPSSPTGIVGSRTKSKLKDVIGASSFAEKDNRDNSRKQVDGESEFSQSDTNKRPDASDNAGSLAELRNQFTIDKWSFTQEEKQTIYNMMPTEVQEKHYEGFLDQEENSSRYGGSDNENESNPNNPLQQRYQQLQNDDTTSLKEQFKGYIALQDLKNPLGLLRKNLRDIFGADTAHAQGIFIFGGRIASVEPCPVPPNALQVTVAGPRPGRFAFIPGASQLRPVYDGVPRPGMNTLGSYAPAPGCFGPPPASTPLTQGTIVLMGVSEI